jgi:hypothetical protein
MARIIGVRVQAAAAGMAGRVIAVAGLYSALKYRATGSRVNPAFS